MPSPIELQLRRIVTLDRFGRYFATGYLYIQASLGESEGQKRQTIERNAVDTLYVHLLLWKPLIHTLLSRALWDRDHLTLYTNFQMKRDPCVYTFGEFCKEYNNIIQPLLAELEQDDLHPNARKPLSAEDLSHFHDFCTAGEGKRIVKLKTTLREDLVDSLERKLTERMAGGSTAE